MDTISFHNRFFRKVLFSIDHYPSLQKKCSIHFIFLKKLKKAWGGYIQFYDKMGLNRIDPSGRDIAYWLVYRSEQT